jgi:hypothetical protein
MALELVVWEIVIAIGLIGYFLGMYFRLPHLFLLGSVLTALSGALLFIFDGLITGHYYTVEGIFTEVIVASSNIGLASLGLVLIAIPIVSFLVIDFDPKARRNASPFHY